MSSRDINIKLLTWGSIQLSATEVLIIARHRHMLAVYVTTLFVMYKLRFHTDEMGLAVWVNVLIYIIAQLLPLPIIIGAFWLCARLARGTEPVPVYATPLIFISILVSASSTEAIVGFLGGNSNLSLWQLLAWSLLQTCYGEILGAVVGNLMLHRMLAQIRFDYDTPQPALLFPAEEAANAPVMETAKEFVAEATQAPPRPTIIVAGQTFPADELLHVRAEGNYVDLTFTKGRLYTLATLTSVVTQLGAVDGCMISRSVWVASRAATGYRRDGDNYVIACIDEREFRVARSRTDRVLPWLKDKFSLMPNG